MGLPGLIGDSFFRVIDTSKDGYLDHTEFINGLSTLYFGEFEDKLKFVFEMYDFDANGIISKEDIRTMLSYVPLSTIAESTAKKEGLFTQLGGGFDAYFDRIQVQNDLIQLFNITLKDKTSISLDDFRSIVSKSSSDMFLCIFMLIREKLPSLQAFLNYKKDYKPATAPSTDGSHSAVLASPRMSKLSPSMSVLSRSPYLKSIVGKGTKLTPSDLFKQYLPSQPQPQPSEKGKIVLPRFEEIPHAEDEMPENISIPVMELNKNNIASLNAPSEIITENLGGVKRLPNVSFVAKNPEFEKMGKTELLMSPSAFLEKRKITSSMAICSCGKLCEIGKVQCSECLSKGKDIHGYLYLKQDSKLKRFWIKLTNSSLFSIEIN
jgi:Ca2+-binding EF-hand superfamily protein